MNASEDVIRLLSQLSRIGVDEEETKGLIRDLTRVLDYCEQLEEAPIEGLRPLSHPIRSLSCPLFDDEVEGEQLLPGREFIKGNPEHLGQMVRVPAVLDEGAGST